MGMDQKSNVCILINKIKKVLFGKASSIQPELDVKHNVMATV